MLNNNVKYGQIQVVVDRTPWPGGLTCWETCLDVCVVKSGKWVLFGPEMREMRDPQNGCEIGTVPFYGYDFCKTPSIRVQLGLK